ncbi:hypothetical protein [Comamonas guangdongensis]|uniref:Uncharacterized protein n=1 Tax=Comamonas guangdongensis TaxID=510515 RepID=A0ABV3ZU04_9BURK
MAQEYFDPVLFIKEGAKTPIHLSRTPFFCNLGGFARYFEVPPSGVQLLEPSISDPMVALGNRYGVRSATTEPTDPRYGEQTRLEFLADQVEYRPLWATSDTAAAFGMTLAEPGQGIRITSPQPCLSLVDYKYGMFAGHRSPYLGTGYRLLPKVCTDLEHHDFPHVFAAVDPHLPLVISVARYWPQRQEICLADLWLPRGKALYVPPRPRSSEQSCLDLHGNRNSALACWQGLGQTSVRTQTLLQTEHSYFCWFWNDLPTTHPLLDPTGAPHA